MRRGIGSACLFTLALCVSGSAIRYDACTGQVPVAPQVGNRHLSTKPAGPALAQARAQVASVPLHFERNAGQVDGAVEFLARGAGYAVYLNGTETTLLLSAGRAGNTRDTGTSRPAVVTTHLAGAARPARLTAEQALPGRVNYYRGRQPAGWRGNVPTYARVRAAAVYPGIDAIYYGNQRQLQYDFEVSPGADPARIALAFDGVDRLEIDPAGELVLHVGDRQLRQKRPFTYQDDPGGRREVESRFVLRGHREAGFEVGDYDPTRPLVIDPVLSYSSYFGGDSEEAPADIALGPGGTVYLTGLTIDVASFPTLNAFQSTSGGQPDAFVTKFQPNGSSLSIVFSTYLGGSADENFAGYGFASDLAVDAAGVAHITGSTKSANFPVTPDADDATYGSSQPGATPNLLDAFYARVGPTGTLLYATYLGGMDTDVGTSIALDTSGRAYILGHTRSDATTEDAPVTGNAYDQVQDGSGDVFIARFTTAGVLDYFTYLGGNGSEADFYNGAIAVDSSGYVYAASDTSSSVSFLPANGFDASFSAVAAPQGFFVKLDLTKTGAAQLLYSTYISGTNGQTWARGLALDNSGQVVIVGETSTSNGFPLKNALQGTYVGGSRDAYVMKVDTTKTGADSLVYSTYLGGDQSDIAWDVALDPFGRPVVVGSTSSASTNNAGIRFPLVSEVAICPSFTRVTSFVTIFNAAGTALDLSSCYAYTYGFYGVAVSGGGDIWLAGPTNDNTTNPPSATGVPMVNAEQSVYGRDFPLSGGDFDALIVRLSAGADLGVTKTGSPNPVAAGANVTWTLTVTNTGPDAAANVVVTDTLSAVTSFVSCSATGGGTCGGSGNTRTVSYASLAAGAASTITIVAQVNAGLPLGTPITNNAVVASSTTDPNAANDAVAASVSTPPPPLPADVSVVKTRSSDVVPPGGTVTYTLTIANAGPGVATGIVVADTLPAGTTFVSCAAPGGTCGGSGNARTITYASLASGASAQATLVAQVNGDVKPSLTLTNTATVTTGSTDSNAGNNSSSTAISTPGLDPTADYDDDSLPNGWEQQFGLDPTSKAQDDGASGDPDGDGFTNKQEYDSGTHPRGFVITYLAEGATISIFSTRILIANPSDTQALVLCRFQRSDGVTVPVYTPVPPRSRKTIQAENVAGLEDAEFSTLVEADVQVVVDRTMTWDQTSYGSHSERGILTRTATEWFFAEGATAFGFDLFFLIQNPNTVAAQVEVTYLLPAGKAPIKQFHAVPPESRYNIWVDAQGPDLANAELSTVIRSTNGVPIIAERAMYFSRPGQSLFSAGHESAGVTRAAKSWFLAEGATGPFFDLFILVANPNEAAADVEARYLLSDGRVIVKRYVVAGNSRFNIWVDLEEGLADQAVATTLTSLNDVSIIVERAMWWPGDVTSWQEGHNSPGTTETGIRWATAEGELGGSQGIETYYLLANTAAFDGLANVTLLFEDGSSPLTRQFLLRANSRTNVNVAADFPEAAGKRFGVVVESVTAPGAEAPAQIVMEYAVYSSANGIFWAAGSNALATKLQ